MRMQRYLVVGLTALAIATVLQISAGRFAGPLPADLRIAQQENPNYPDEPTGPYVQQHLENQEGGAGS
jgi:hypothetical protein